jgi:hypothetical protein
MPLDAQDEVRGSALAGLSTLYGLDDSILRAAGGDAKAISRDANGLMVAGVDGETEEFILCESFGRVQKGAQEGVRGDYDGVGYGYASSGGVVYGKDCEILHQGPPAPHIEELEAEADGEDGFIEVVGVLDEEFVDILPGVVGWRALGDCVLCVLLRIDIGGAAGEQDSLAGIDEVGDLRWGGSKGNFHGSSSAALYGDGILRPGSLVIGEVCACGDGDRDAGFHG